MEINIKLQCSDDNESVANDDSTHEQEAEARIDVTEPLSVSSDNTLHRKHNDSISHLQGMLLNE